MNYLLKNEYQQQQINLKKQILTKIESSSQLNIKKNKQQKEIESCELINEATINQRIKLKVKIKIFF